MKPQKPEFGAAAALRTKADRLATVKERILCKVRCVGVRELVILWDSKERLEYAQSECIGEYE